MVYYNSLQDNIFSIFYINIYLFNVYLLCVILNTKNNKLIIIIIIISLSSLAFRKEREIILNKNIKLNGKS